MDPRVVPADRGTLKHPRVGWEFSGISAFAWVFFAPLSHSDPTHRVGIFKPEWEKSEIVRTSTHIFVVNVYIFHKRWRYTLQQVIFCTVDPKKRRFKRAQYFSLQK